MNICFVTPEFVTEAKNFDGGLSNYLCRVSLGLLELGHIPIIIVASDITEVIVYKDIEVHRVKVDNQLEAGVISELYQSYVLNRYLKQYVQKNIVDVVQYASFMGVGYYRLSNTPAVVRISSYAPLLVTGYGHDVNLFRDDILLEEIAIKRADAVFGPSQLLAREIEKNCNRPVQVIESPFTYDVHELDYTYFETFHLEKYLLFFGTLGLLKGVKTIAEALPAVFSQYPELKFVFIGKDAGFNGMNMMDYVYAQAGIYWERVIHIDKLEHKRLYPFVEKALAVILPSRIDNFPNTCIEAMAHGKIVIGTRDTGFEQLIQDGANGFLCERDSPESLFHAIEKAINLSAEHKMIMEQCAIERIKQLQPKYVISDLIDFYKKTIAEKKTRMKNCSEYDDFATNHLWEKLIEMDQERSALLSQFQKLQTQSLQDMSAIQSSKTYRIGRILARIIDKWFPLKSKRRAFLLLIYGYMGNFSSKAD